MKLRLLTLLFSSVCLSWIITGCTPDNPQPNSPTSNNVNVKWNATFNGISDSYVGTYTNLNSNSNYMNNPGDCKGSYMHVIMKKGVVPGNAPSPFGYTAQIELSYTPSVGASLSVGTFNISNTTGSGKALTIVTDLGSFTSLNYNSNISVNITAFPSNIGGLIKGNFNGVIGTSALNPNCPTYPVSGSFEAIRLL
jgi:hypothetical protein